jgi:hypothetical protein
MQTASQHGLSKYGFEKELSAVKGVKIESFGRALQKQAGGNSCKGRKYFKPVHRINTAEKKKANFWTGHQSIKKGQLALAFLFRVLLTQLLFLQLVMQRRPLLDGLLTRCKPLVRCRQHGSHTSEYECNHLDGRYNVDLTR